MTSVCRADLIAYLTPAQVGHFADHDMLELAGEMADAYLDQAFWIHLEILSKDVLDDAEH